MNSKIATLLAISLALPASATWPASPTTHAGEPKQYKVSYGEPGKDPLGTVDCDEGNNAIIRWKLEERLRTFSIVHGGAINFKIENRQPILMWAIGQWTEKYKFTTKEIPRKIADRGQKRNPEQIQDQNQRPHTISKQSQGNGADNMDLTW
ncbi:hypothetical protein PspLS_02785 [Pyricularia sp. CBS 133598]|nr:hypothetical protein PspLS_02785 [Pyricularia sp. CBS 133598]